MFLALLDCFAVLVVNVLSFDDHLGNVISEKKRVLLHEGDTSWTDQITELNRKMASMELKMKALEARQNQAPVAFSAYLSKSIPNIGPSQHVIFDKVTLNLGNTYSSVHGAFTAPVNGTYLLSMHACSAPSHYVVLEMVNNNDVIGTVLAGNTDYHDCADKTVVAKLQYGTSVIVRHHQTLGDYLYSTVYDFPSFTGVLLQAL